jgi:histidinol-phosphate aminotransferase
MNPALLARPEILGLEPYAHATWDPALERLNANENPWRGPRDATVAGLNRYPEPHPRTLEARLATLYGVAPEALLAGRGSDEGIDLLVRAFCRPNEDAVLTCPPTFGMYAVSARIQAARLVEVPLTAEFAIDEPALFAAAAKGVKLLFLCSPNNPTGAPLPAGLLERVLARLSGSALVVVDEAYAEFSREPSAIPLIARFPNLVVLRTLSKAYALAGARIGAVMAVPEVIGVLRRIVPPYAIAVPASEAAFAALESEALVTARARIQSIVRERGRLGAALARVPGIERVWPSEANFLLVEAADPAAVMRAAAGAGLLLRDFSHQRATAGCIRITVGDPAQNARLLAALDPKAPR